MSLKILFVTLSLSVASLTNAAFSQTEKSEAEIQEAAAICSIFQTCISNYATYSSGDFLVREQMSFDSVDLDDLKSEGALLSGEILTRHVFDYEAKKYGFYKWVRVSESDLELPDSSGRKTMMRGFCGTGKHIFSRRFPEKRSKSAYSEQAMAQATSGSFYFDIRGIGIVSTPSSNSYEIAQKSANIFSSGTKLVRKSESDKRLTLTLQTQVRTTGTKVFRDYTFDLDTNMPIKVVERYKVKNEDGTYMDTTGHETTFRWEERGGVYVPKQFVFEGVTAKSVNGKQHIGQVQRIFDFHWFSHNQPAELKQEAFSGSALESITEFVKIVDPKRAGADSLIDETDKDDK
jgi:hypothetical protein